MKKWIQYKTYFFFLKEQKIKIVDTKLCVLDKHIHLITLRNKKIGMVDDVQYPKNGSFKPIAMWLLCMNNMLIWILMAKPIKSLHIGSLFCIEQCTNDPPVGRSHIRLHTPAPAGKYGLLIMFRLLAWQTGKKKTIIKKNYFMLQKILWKLIFKKLHWFYCNFYFS